jgi:hypothetical protein
MLAKDEMLLRAAYLDQVPDAEMILTLAGFHFYLLRPTRVRLIASFGSVKWLTPPTISALKFSLYLQSLSA